MDKSSTEHIISAGNKENCLLCGKPLVYYKAARTLRCAICGEEKSANAACEAGHFVCDECHRGGGAEILNFLGASDEKDPVKLFLQVCQMQQVHMHGPEHHSILPCVLLTAYRNCGGDIELSAALREAWERGKKVPGGACGFLGVCGSAVGAGIFASILHGSTPLSAEVWHKPQQLSAKVLQRLSDVGGPRCCKRNGRLAIETAAEYAKVHFGVEMPLSRPACTFCAQNAECIQLRCPFFAVKK